MKVDVEGAEIRVFQGAAETLRQLHPVILFEAGRDEPQEEAFAYLRDCGYDEFWDQSSLGSDTPVPPRLEAPLTNVVATSSRVWGRLHDWLPKAGKRARRLTRE